MHLICPACSREITGQDVNIAAAIAKCPNCHAVFSFNASQIKGSPAVSLPRAKSPKPSQIQVDDSGRDLKIWWSWFHWGLLPLLGFCLFWNGFLVVWYSIVIGLAIFGDGNAGGGLWLMALFPLLHVAVGVTLGYGTLAGLLNTTTLEVSGGILTVRHGPIPWWGNVEVESKDIQQLYCSFGNWQASASSQEGQGGGNFDLIAILADGSKMPVVSGQADPDAVWFLEQTLEKKLKIEDERVAGEYVG